jgi:Tol biopolymer transport system component
MADGSVQNLTSKYRISRIHENVAWISEGKRIAFVGALAGQNPSVLSISREGGDLLELADSLSGYQQAWTQDGERLAFVRRDDKRNRHHIWIMGSDSGTAKRMTLGLPK